MKTIRLPKEVRLDIAYWKKADKWFYRLQGLAAKIEWPVCDFEDWKDYFDEGYTPKDALAEDVSYNQG